MKHYHAPELVDDTGMSYGGILTAGRKLPGGGVGGKHVFWIVQKSLLGSGHSKFHPPHRRFDAFNSTGLCTNCKKQCQAKECRACAQLDGPGAGLRVSIDAILLHANEPEFHEIHFGAFRGPNAPGVINPQTAHWWCRGDGETANRWNGDGYDEIECPGNACAFRQRGECKFRFRLLFMPQWGTTDLTDVPEIPLMYASTAEKTKRSFRQMLRDARDIVRGMGLDVKSWQGFPFVIQHGFATSERRRSKYTDVSFAPGDIRAWLQRQHEQRAELGAAPAVMALTTGEMQTGEAHFDAASAIDPKLEKPAVIDVEPVEAEPAVETEFKPGDEITNPKQFAETLDSIEQSTERKRKAASEPIGQEGAGLIDEYLASRELEGCDLADAIDSVCGKAVEVDQLTGDQGRLVSNFLYRRSGGTEFTPTKEATP